MAAGAFPGTGVLSCGWPDGATPWTRLVRSAQPGAQGLSSELTGVSPDIHEIYLCGVLYRSLVYSSDSRLYCSLVFQHICSIRFTRIHKILQ